MAVAEGVGARLRVPSDVPRAAPKRRRWGVRAAAAAALAVTSVTLFAAYLRMSRTQPMNADGASQALQGWDLLHGNLLLSGWTVSDVSFYANELVLFAIVEALNGLNADAVHIVAAILYTLLVFAVALVAKGRATGREAVARIAVAVAVMLVPASGMGSWVLLGSADHTGTGVPLLLTWLLLDRGLTRRDGAAPRWLPYGVGAMLVWGQISDPLVMFIGALPLAMVGVVRMWRAGQRTPRQWRGTDARLVGAAVGSVLVAHALVAAVTAAGGFHIHGVPVRFAKPERFIENLINTAETLAVNFGAYFPDRQGGPLDVAMGAFRLVGLLTVAATTIVILVRILRRRSESRVDEVLAVGVAVNVGAYVVSTLPWDLTSARQTAAVLTLGAALAGRVWGPRLAPRRWMPAVVAVLALVYGGEFVARTTERPVPPASAHLASWLESRNLTYGLGGFWSANDITLITGGRVQVVPVVGDKRVYGYRWLSNEEWYDSRRHDARFVIVDRAYPPHGSEASAVAAFGAPIERHDFGRHVILVYDHNLLVDLPADCVPGHAPRMADCDSTNRLQRV